ncbi:MAG: hypothetical protein ACYDDI_00595 [Candidatus Acidiferrales bacterium]
MNSPTPFASDDKLAIISIAALAGVLQNVLHEGLGHGVTAWLSGAHRVTMSTVALQSDISTRLISANGTLVNLIFGALFWLLLLRPRRYSAATHFFFVMAMAGNLFSGTGYFLFSGVANFGDWADVIHGLQPYGLWRVGLVVLGLITYFASMLIVSKKLRPFHRKDANPRRIRGLAWIPYFTEGILAALGGLFNPIGFFYVVASALPSTLGANAGLLNMPAMLRHRFAREGGEVGPIPRSVPWIFAGAAASFLFIFVLARGLTWTR